MATRDSNVSNRRPRDIPSTRKAFLLAIFVIAQCIFLSSSMFRVGAVEVTGNSHVRDDVIKAQASLPLQGHLFCVPLRAIEDRVRTLHWVSDVAVRRYMPGRIQIRVKERTPVVAASHVGEEGAFPKGWFVVSEDGMVLAPAGERGDDRLPRVQVATPLLVGHRLHAGLVAAVRKTLEALPRGMAGSVTDLRADEQGQMFLNMAIMGRPVEVRLGGPERSVYKFEILQALTARLQEEGKPVAYIDLRYTDPAVGHVVSAAPEIPQNEAHQ